MVLRCRTSDASGKLNRFRSVVTSMGNVVMAARLMLRVVLRMTSIETALLDSVLTLVTVQLCLAETSRLHLLVCVFLLKTRSVMVSSMLTFRMAVTLTSSAPYRPPKLLRSTTALRRMTTKLIIMFVSLSSDDVRSRLGGNSLATKLTKKTTEVMKSEDSSDPAPPVTTLSIAYMVTMMMKVSMVPMGLLSRAGAFLWDIVCGVHLSALLAVGGATIWDGRLWCLLGRVVICGGRRLMV